jgi:hypothetical protein
VDADAGAGAGPVTPTDAMPVSLATGAENVIVQTDAPEAPHMVDGSHMPVTAPSATGTEHPADTSRHRRAR